MVMMNVKTLSDEVKQDIFDTLDQFIVDDGFCEFVDSPCEEKWYNCGSPIDVVPEQDINFSCGATKGVVIDYELGYAIKIPFWVDDDNRLIVDHCRYEWRNYVAACEAGYGEMFVPTYYVGKWCGLDIYAQDIVDCDEERITDVSYEHSYQMFCDEEGLDPADDASKEEFSSRGCYYDDDENEAIIATCVDQWGVDYDKFTDFLAENRVSDMHEGNWSITNDKLMLVDYSGYKPFSNGNTTPADWFSIID